MDLSLGKLIREAADQIEAVPAKDKKKIARRSFQAARVNRLTGDWVTAPITANQILRGDLRKLRARSRDVCRNDPNGKKYLQMMQTNVVGTGINLQVKFDDAKTYTSDSETSKRIEKAFKLWSKKDFCSISQKLSWFESKRLAVRMLARDGEVIIRKIFDSKNPFGFSLKFYSGDWLDESYNATAPNGNRIIMSVEVDKYERAVAFWLCPPVSDYMYQRTRKRTRVPASEIYHLFMFTEDEEQTRGIPWLHASMMRMRHLEGYEEAELVGKRVAACHMGFYIPPEDAAVSADEEDESGFREDLLENAEPGIFRELPPDYDFKTFDPKQTDANDDSFKTRNLQAIASGGDVSYHELTGDLTKVNYSSARIGSLSERDVYKVLHLFLIEYFCEPVFRDWKESAFLSGALDISDRDYDRIVPVFRGRGWAWVDPLKDANAAVVGLENNFTSLTDVLAEKGQDIQDFFETRQREKELAAQYGITLEYGKIREDAKKLLEEDEEDD